MNIFENNKKDAHIVNSLQLLEGMEPAEVMDEIDFNIKNPITVLEKEFNEPFSVKHF